MKIPPEGALLLAKKPGAFPKKCLYVYDAWVYMRAGKCPDGNCRVLRKFHDQKAPAKAEIFLFPSGLFMEFVPYYEGVRLFNRPVEKEKFYETKK